MVATPSQADERQPTIVHCGVCAEEWIAAWVPAEVSVWVAEMRKNSTCPGCGAVGAALMGKASAIEGTARG